MKRFSFVHIFAVGALCSAVSVAIASAEVKLAALFQDHMVLQCGQPLPVWGSAAAGEKISVTFAGQNVSATAGEDGAWKVILTPVPVNATPATFTVTGNNEIKVQDVVVGEVWLCSGQSNMGFDLSRVQDAQTEIASGSFPLIRQFQTRYAFKNEPQTSAGGAWVAASPETAGKFTAVGYFFAREIHQKLGVPIGIIRSTWGGTDIESWMSGSSLAAAPELKFVAEHWQKRLDAYPALKAKFDADSIAWQQKADDAKAKGEPPPRSKPNAPANPDGTAHQDKASALFNGMIAPLVPYAIRGVLWYQGENNAGRADEYALLQPALITGWRQAFAQPELPFFWVQLPNFRGNPKDTDWVQMREAQAKSLALPATGQAIAIDVGDPNDIHPINKKPVGERLARLALNRVYHQKIVDSGPRFAGVKFEAGTARVEFSDIAGGLRFEGETLTGFEVAGADQKFALAAARIDGASVLVSAPTVAAPVAVRYAWHNAPAANLANSEGLPAAPFHSGR